MSKVFVTGIYDSGKTTLAQRLAAAREIPYVSFDALHDYTQSHDQAAGILASLPESFVIDAIPFTADPPWDAFFDYAAQHEVEVICTYCPNFNVWLDRVRAKRRERRFLARVKRFVLRNVKKLLGTYKPPKPRVDPKESRGNIATSIRPLFPGWRNIRSRCGVLIRLPGSTPLQR